jgi:hypothetical protein
LEIEIVACPAEPPLWFDQNNLNRIKYLKLKNQFYNYGLK